MRVLRCLVSPLGFGLALWLMGAGVARHSASLGALVSGAGGVLLLALSTPLVGRSLLRPLERRFRSLDVSAYPRVDAIVVLGAGVPKGATRTSRETGASLARLLHGIRLHRAGRGQYLVLSGGRNRHSACEASEGSRMRELALELGICPRNVLVEETSSNTAENASRTRDLLQERGLRTVLLVTSSWHMRRAVVAFRSAGVEVTPAPTDDSAMPQISLAGLLLPSVGALDGSSLAIREYLGLLWLAWTGGGERGVRSQESSSDRRTVC